MARAFIVWNKERTEGFVTFDDGLAYEVRKSSTFNCFTSEGRKSVVGQAFCEQWGYWDCTTEVVEL